MSTSVATQASTRVPCNLCGLDDVKIVHPAGTAQAGEIVRCNRCGLMYVCPRQEADVDRITKWADDPSFDPVAVNPLRADKEKCQVRDYRSTRALMASCYPERGDLVEIGSSLGFGLAAWHNEGWTVRGVNPDKAGCRHTSSASGSMSAPRPWRISGCRRRR